MEKTISITLNNQNFVIEEDAYNKLSDYLENIKAHCGAGADSAEVIADIENSMAEKLKSNLTPYKEVITSTNVDALIEIMGTAEDFDREVGGTTANNQTETDEAKVERKLYRDMDNAIIGGVSAGLGNYFNVDPVLIRVIFIALIFAGGSAFPIYILLWIAMPEAKTAHQKLEMKGQAPTLAAFKNLSKTGKKIQDNWKKRWQKRSTLGKIVTLPAVIIRGLMLGLQKIWSKLWPIIKFCFGFFMILMALLVLVGVCIGSFYLLLQANSNYSFEHIPLRELSMYIPFTWLLLTGFLSLALPSILAIIGGLLIIKGKKIISLQSAAIIFGLWILVGIIFSALSLRYIPELKEKIDNHPSRQRITQTIDLENFTNINANGDQINIIIESSTGTSSSAILIGRTVDLAQIALQKNGADLNINENRLNKAYCFDCNINPITIKISAPTLKSLNVKETNIKISSDLKQALKIKASDASLIELIDTNISDLNADLSDSANLLVTGHIASTTLIVDDARVNFDDFNGNLINLTMRGDAAANWKGQVDNFNISSIERANSDDTYDGSVDASALTVKKMTINSLGALTVVSGPTLEIQANLSDNSRLFYTGKTKINGDQKNKPIVLYTKISKEEYSDAEDRKIVTIEQDYDDSLDLIINNDSSLIHASNGKYFRLLRGELSNKLFKTLSVDFKRWLD